MGAPSELGLGAGERFLGLLERRLDAVVYRAKFVPTTFAARQFVNHGHVTVNGQRVNIPSYRVRAHDIIDVAEKSLTMTPLVIARETHGDRAVPAWLEARPNRMRILVHQLPVREQIVVDVQEQMIVALYSK